MNLIFLIIFFIAISDRLYKTGYGSLNIPLEFPPEHKS